MGHMITDVESNVEVAGDTDHVLLGVKLNNNREITKRKITLELFTHLETYYNDGSRFQSDTDRHS